MRNLSLLPFSCGFYHHHYLCWSPSFHQIFNKFLYNVGNYRHFGLLDKHLCQNIKYHNRGKFKLPRTMLFLSLHYTYIHVEKKFVFAYIFNVLCIQSFHCLLSEFQTLSFRVFKNDICHKQQRIIKSAAMKVVSTPKKTSNHFLV